MFIDLLAIRRFCLLQSYLATNDTWGWRICVVCEKDNAIHLTLISPDTLRKSTTCQDSRIFGRD